MVNPGLWPRITNFRSSTTTQELKNLQEKTEMILYNNSNDENNEASGIEQNDLIDEANSASSHQGLIEDLETSVSCLMDMILTLESTFQYVSKKAQYSVAPPATFAVSEPAKAYFLHVSHQFPSADTRLVERLGEANWQRHQDIHARIGLVEVNSDNAPQQTLTKSVFVPATLFPDLGLGSSLPAASSRAASGAPHVSFVSSKADQSEGKLRATPNPAEVGTGKPFKCDICHHVLHNMNNRID